MSTQLYANPYDLNFTGFYFESVEKFQKQMKKAKFEEVEIDYIDGDNPSLFEAAGINQGNISIWFQELEDIDDNDDTGIAIRYLRDTGLDLQDAIERADEVQIWHGSSEDYAAELIEECYDMGSIPDTIKYHIDYAGIANDMDLNSEITEIEHGIWVTNCLDF